MLKILYGIIKGKELDQLLDLIITSYEIKGRVRAYGCMYLQPMLFSITECVFSLDILARKLKLNFVFVSCS